MADDKRLTDLEVKVAFQEHLLHELDDVIRGLQNTVDTLRREIHELREQLPEDAEDPNQKPPHY